MGLISRVSSRTYRNTMNDYDNLIRYRLLVDGEGNLEDKKISHLARTMIEWAEHPESSSTTLEFERTLSQVESLGLKNTIMMRMLEQEKNSLNDLKLDEQIDEYKEKVVQQEERLAEAKKIRKYEEEADALAAIVEREP